jgi:hypothetical protein
MTTSLEGGEGSASRPGRSSSSGKTRYPLYSRLGGSQGRTGQVRKISPPPGFDPRTVQPVSSRYTDYATRPTLFIYTALHFSLIRASHPQAAVINIHRGNSCSGHKIIKIGIALLYLLQCYSESLLFTSCIRLRPVLFIDSKVGV